MRDLLLAHVRPRAIVSLGFAGGVAPDVYGGDLVVPRTIRGLDYSGALDGAITPDPYLFESALEALEDEFIAVHTDEVVTLPETLFTLEQKEQFAPVAAHEGGRHGELLDWQAGTRGAHPLPGGAAPSPTRRKTPSPTTPAFSTTWARCAPSPRPAITRRIPGTSLKRRGWQCETRGKEQGNLAVFGETFIKKVYRAAPVVT